MFNKFVKKQEMGDDSPEGEEHDEEAAETKASSEDELLDEQVGTRGDKDDVDEEGGREEEDGGREEEDGGREEDDGGREDEDGGREEDDGGREDEDGGRDEIGQDDSELDDERRLKERGETKDRCNDETDPVGRCKGHNEEEVRKMNGDTKKDGGNKEEDEMSGCEHGTSARKVSFHLLLNNLIIIIRQPLCPVVGRRPQHVVSK